MKQTDRDMFKKASKSVRASSGVASPDPLSPTPSTSSTMKASKNTEEDHDDPEPADEEDIQMEYSSDWFEQPKDRRSNKTLPIRT
jgi:hypothetical protein